MFKNRPEVVLLVYGKGGHTAQMNRYIEQQPHSDMPYIAITSAHQKNQNLLRTFYCMEARDKFSQFKNIFIFIIYFFYSIALTVRILFSYKIVGMVSTGPGLAVVPSLICRLVGAKVIYFESWSRFLKPSLAGRFMYRIAHLFFIQHESMKLQYPNAIYVGRL